MGKSRRICTRTDPGRSGLFLALTGAPLNASDAKLAGLADFTLPHERLADVLDAISAEAWHGERDADAARLSHLLDRGVDLHTHVEDVASVLSFEDLERVVLVGSSSAGMVVTAVAEPGSWPGRCSSS